MALTVNEDIDDLIAKLSGAQPVVVIRQDSAGVLKIAEDQEYTGGASHAIVKNTAASPVPIAETDPAVLSAFERTMVGGDEITVPTGYRGWVFEVKAVDSDDDITIQVSFDAGTTYHKLGLVNLRNGTYIDQGAANIEATGIYAFGVATNIFSPPIPMDKIKVVRETTTGANVPTVIVRGYP